LSAGMLILALSSLSRNSRYIGLFWVGVWFVTFIVGVFLSNIHRNQLMYAKFQKARELQRSDASRGKSLTTQEQMKRQHDEEMKAYAEMEQQELEDSKTNWRPVVSYTDNLSRVGEAILGTNACWQKLSKTKPEAQRAEYLLRNMGPQYPWYWSAAVLIVLFGISVCILNFRVKSLDRLR
ncbi:MAG TPA: hypothetical protein VG122_01970, partial [Gemmata sp.]|nr:hypothetical protein [Gemmata sp.]